MTPVARAQSTVANRGWTFLAGIATGDGSWDTGLAVAAGYRMPIAASRLSVRFEPWLSRYGGGDGASLFILGASALPRFIFTPTESNRTPYILGGPGYFYRNFSYTARQTGTSDIHSSDGRFGVTIGGGLQFGTRFVSELRVTDIDGYLTIPILVGLRF